MQAEVGVGMSLCVVGDFSQPWTWDDDARRSYVILIECFKTGRVFRVRNRKIVGVDDQEFAIGGVAEALSDTLRLSESGLANGEA